ncbi:MAG: hypothetical protein IIW08_08385 [Clostridia bacterium]|nr:hypothetical protein [Clostridia bacterium]MBQ2434486.1 hypothetical protein [Clostridia bacterium]MBQ5771179.1 hypothetical protein [Clostridia bacterium]
MEISAVLQLIATFSAAWGAFSAYRARDNARAAALSEIRADITHIMKRLDRIEDGRICKIERTKREESA